MMGYHSGTQFPDGSMPQANINPALLTWARERAGLSLGLLARKLNLKEERLAAWERSEAVPTFRQAQNFAQHTHIPFGFLFLHMPPADELPIPDLRSVGDHQPGRISIDLKDTLRDVLRRQLWYREHQQELDAEPVAVVGRARGMTDIESIVADMRARLGVATHPERGSWEDYFRDLIARIEKVGVLVMRSGIVGNNTHRVLDVREFRGFAMVDGLAPIIFINSADCPEARLFTLIHELAHVWLDQSGISDGDTRSHHATERLCNGIAAEFLVPRAEFLPQWQRDTDWKDNLPPLAARFHVSQWVIARRARELDLIDEQAYRQYVEEQLARHRAREKSGGGSFHRAQPSRVSHRFARAVAGEALSGRLLLRDAEQLIGIHPHQLATFAQKELGL
jgi:Zn-dependent peptidase ImmA (M78 family)